MNSYYEPEDEVELSDEDFCDCGEPALAEGKWAGELCYTCTEERYEDMRIEAMIDAYEDRRNERDDDWGRDDW